VNHDTGYVYVANYYWDRWGGKWSLTILSATEVITTLNVIGSAEISPIGVNATSGYIYVLDYYGGSTVLSGTQIVGPFLSGYSAAAITVDSINGYAYVTNYDNSDVAVVSGTQTVERVSVGNSPRPIGVNPVNGLAYVPIPGDGCVSILGNMLVPGSLTPSLLDSASEDLLIDFLKPVLTSTVPFSISPSVPFTVTWSPASDLATISHAPLAIGTRYTLHVLPGGQAVSGLGVAEWKFVYAYYPFHFFLPLIEK
jgi:DNA-binding beta-propeller fold protein YncE